MRLLVDFAERDSESVFERDDGEKPSLLMCLKFGVVMGVGREV